jgi:hypothetical protein
MWRRRELLNIIGAGTAAALLPRVTEAREDGTGGGNSLHGEQLEACCQICADCASECNKAFQHCLAQTSGAKPKYAQTARTIIDCATFCELSATLLSRRSTLMSIACRACADACRRCALECTPFDTDITLRMCVRACERCEQSCRVMVEATNSSDEERRARFPG